MLLLAALLGSHLHPTALGHWEAPQLPGFLQHSRDENKEEKKKNSLGLLYLKEARSRQDWEKSLSHGTWDAAPRQTCGDRWEKKILEGGEKG